MPCISTKLKIAEKFRVATEPRVETMLATLINVFCRLGTRTSGSRVAEGVLILKNMKYSQST